MAIVKYIEGDITKTELKFIAHGVNCQNKMRSGVAKALYTKWPGVKGGYHEYFKTFSDSKPCENFLGKFHMIPLKSGRQVFNCFTQDKFGYDGKEYVSYDAIEDIFRELVKFADGPIAIPKIGCGLAGGNWTIVENIINEVTGDDLDVWVYQLGE